MTTKEWTFTAMGTIYRVRPDGWCEDLGCWVFRGKDGRVVTVPVD